MPQRAGDAAEVVAERLAAGGVALNGALRAAGALGGIGGKAVVLVFANLANTTFVLIAVEGRVRRLRVQDLVQLLPPCRLLRGLGRRLLPWLIV